MSQAATKPLPAIGDEKRESIVNVALDEISHIATLPEVTMKIIEVVEDPSATAQDLNEIISNDPALCARVLKVVNSAFYGLPGQIASINRAIVLLGLNAVKNIAIAASLAKLFRGGQISENFNAKDLWTHSIGTAAAVKLIAEKAGLNLLDEAFLAGLIHDLGVMIEMQAIRPKLIETFDYMAEHKCCFLDAEEAVIGANHQDFGRALCERWKFPRSIAMVTGFHHNPMVLDRESRTLTAMVYVADQIADQCELGFAKHAGDIDLDPAVLEDLKLTNSMITELVEQVPEAFEAAEQLLA